MKGPNGIALFLPALPKKISSNPITDPSANAVKLLTKTMRSPKYPEMDPTERESFTSPIPIPPLEIRAIQERKSCHPKPK